MAADLPSNYNNSSTSDGAQSQATYRCEPIAAALAGYSNVTPQPCERAPVDADVSGASVGRASKISGSLRSGLSASFRMQGQPQPTKPTVRNVQMQPYTVDDSGKLAALKELLDPENQGALNVGWEDFSTQVMPLFLLSEDGACV